MRPFDAMDDAAVAALRVLAIDQVEAANSGHPGLPLGAAPMAWVLWSRLLKHDPADPSWPDRDRFVLSAGHGSALLYALLHLFGYDLGRDDLRRFRQWGSRTPGHPEYGLTPGVETTTGPLGQGLANAVGMAIAERHLAARFNRPGYPLVDHRTWVLASDGDLQEGVAHEAAALAGHLKLGRLVVLWDDNRITIEGDTALAWSEDVLKRFAALGWRTLAVEDGNDLPGIASALAEAAAQEEAPVLVRVSTQIGYGSPHKAGSAEAHGAPLGAEEARLTRQALGWREEEPFAVPPEVYSWAATCAAPGRAAHLAWRERLAAYRANFPEAATEWQRRLAGELPADWEEALPDFSTAPPMATRQASGIVLNALAGRLPELVGGSADLAPSNNSRLHGEASVQAGRWGGRNLHFGVREHAMAAVCNGLSLHGGVRPYAATFLIFADYLRPALRLAALMHRPVIYIFTHDSVAVGEDGPTHQPVEHLASLRAIPNLVVLRPADAHETREAWRVALARRDGPTALILTRQKLPALPPLPPGAVARGAYIRAEAGGGAPAVVLLATGSEVPLALAAHRELEASGVPTRVVSMPSWELFTATDETYQRQTLGPPGALRVAVEMGRSLGWERWVGDGLILALDRFGASAPGDEVAQRLGFSHAAVVERVQQALTTRRPAPLAVTLPPARAGAVAGKHARLASLHALARLTCRDVSLWPRGPARRGGEPLGWLDLPARTRGELDRLWAQASAWASEGVRTLYLVGLGPAPLAPWALRHTLGAPSGREVEIVDTLEPTRVLGVLESFSPHESAVLALAPEAATVEQTVTLLELFWERLFLALGERAGHRCVAVGAHASQLERFAHDHRFASFYPHPCDVGARFSAHTAATALAAVWLGLEAEALLSAAERSTRLAAKHPATELAALLSSLADPAGARVAWCPSPSLRPLGVWLEQLIAGTTGKEGRGILPLLPAVVPSPARAWPATLFLSPRLEGEATAELDAALDALAAAGHVVARWPLRRRDLGASLPTLELAAALTALLLGVNPFAESPPPPRQRRPSPPLRRRLPTPAPPHWPSLAAHLAAFSQLGAVAVFAYLPERKGVWDGLRALAERLEEKFRVPVTFGFAPRHALALGPLLMHGPAGFVSVVLTAVPGADLSVPGPRGSLAQQFNAHATALLEQLALAGRHPLHVHLGEEPEAALTSLAEG